MIQIEEEWSDRLIKESDVMQIIDKYKAESEEQMPPERDCVNCVYSKDGHISFSETCHNCTWENQFIPKFMPKRIKASDIKPDDEWMQEDVWDDIYKKTVTALGTVHVSDGEWKGVDVNA